MALCTACGAIYTGEFGAHTCHPDDIPPDGASRRPRGQLVDPAEPTTPRLRNASEIVDAAVAAQAERTALTAARLAEIAAANRPAVVAEYGRRLAR